MKLYLSSYRIPDLKKFSDFVGKEPAEIKMGLILNSKDYKPAAERLAKAEELLKYFSGLGLQVEEIDLRDYVQDNSKLLEKFQEMDVIWLNGGNTFRLNWIISEAKCENILKQALKNGVVYGGDSAGAIIVGPTLKYYNSADDPSVAEKIIYKGLNFVDFAVLPHWGSVEYGAALEDIKRNLEKDNYKTITLTDDEFLLINDGKILNT